MSAIATLTRRIDLLMAVRVGESWPPQLARQIATIDRMTAGSTGGGRLKINIISSGLPGGTLAPAPRYARTVEAMAILKDTGAAIRARSLASTSAGVAAQAALREGAADDGYAEENLWTGAGRARSGCGAVIVGDPDQVRAKLRMYQDMGIEAFILCGYPHAAEADLFARHVLPRIDHAPL